MEQEGWKIFLRENYNFRPPHYGHSHVVPYIDGFVTFNHSSIVGPYFATPPPPPPIYFSIILNRKHYTRQALHSLFFSHFTLARVIFYLSRHIWALTIIFYAKENTMGFVTAKWGLLLQTLKGDHLLLRLIVKQCRLWLALDWGKHHSY